MSTQDNLEKILRQMHILISKGETFDESKDKVIISKKEMLRLLKDLNICVYNMMDEYELTQQGHDKAERAARKLGEGIVKDAQKKAEDVYAASVLYTNEALNHIQRIIQNASDSMDDVFQSMKDELEERKDTVRENQLELEGQLHDLADTNKYLQLIEERNKELAKERMGTKKTAVRKKPGRPSAYPEPEIKINKEYFIRNGIPLEPEKEEPEKEEPELEEKETEIQVPEKQAPEIKVNLDAEYFKWKKEHNKDRKSVV